MEAEVSTKSSQLSDLETVRREVMTLTLENTRLQGEVRELQTQVFTLQAKSPEVSWCVSISLKCLKLTFKL